MLQWLREALKAVNQPEPSKDFDRVLRFPETLTDTNDLRELANRFTKLWPGDERFFPYVQIKPLKQVGPTCVANCLAMLTNQTPAAFIGRMNTQDPVTWSTVLKPYEMKLAYCPTDIRRLEFYAEELVALNDLFLLCYYTTNDPDILLAAPRSDGSRSGSHVVILKGDRIFDPSLGEAVPFKNHVSLDYPTKRIFRVIPAGHERGL